MDGKVAEGAVPVNRLNLPDEFMYDGWGREFGYAVWTGATAVGGLSTYGLSTNRGEITVKNPGGTNRSAAAVYGLISYGPDGHGGYLATGIEDSSTQNSSEAKAWISPAGIRRRCCQRRQLWNCCRRLQQ